MSKRRWYTSEVTIVHQRELTAAERQRAHDPKERFGTSALLAPWSGLRDWQLAEMAVALGVSRTQLGDKHKVREAVERALAEKRLVALRRLPADSDGKQPPVNTVARNTATGANPFMMIPPPLGTNFRDRVKKLVQRGDFIILVLESGTNVTVPLKFPKGLDHGTYEADTTTGKLTPKSKATLPPGSQLLPPGVGMPATLTYEVPAGAAHGDTKHRIVANPAVSKAPIGTRFKFWVEMDPELGGSYRYKWRLYEDPATAKANGRPEVVEGSTQPVYEATSAFVGRHRIACELTCVGSSGARPAEKLEYLQLVENEEELLQAAYATAKAPNYTVFRLELEYHNLMLAQGVLRDQSGLGLPFIKTTAPNPAVLNRAPDMATYTYTVVPVANAKKFRWYVRCANWHRMATESLPRLQTRHHRR